MLELNFSAVPWAVSMNCAFVSALDSFLPRFLAHFPLTNFKREAISYDTRRDLSSLISSSGHEFWARMRITGQAISRNFRAWHKKLSRFITPPRFRKLRVVMVQSKLFLTNFLQPASSSSLAAKRSKVSLTCF